MKSKGTIILKVIACIFVVSLITIFAISCAPEEEVVDEEVEEEVVDEEVEEEVDDKYGGTLEIAKHENVPNIDPDQSTSPEVGEIAYHILEGLFELNEEYEPIPHLAESYEIADDDKTYTFYLREGVLFHNGQEMTAEDVKASMERWMSINGGGQMIEPYVDSIEILDDYTIQLELNEVYAPLISIMGAFPANQKLSVWPKDLLDEYGEDVIPEIIGTGPYKLSEFVDDQYVAIERFDDYVPVDEPGSAYSGEKKAYLDRIVFRYAPEEAVRISGVQAGDYHIGDSIGMDHFETLEAHPDVQPHPGNRRHTMITFDCSNPPADDVRFRRAINYAIDVEELASILIGVEEFYEFDSSWMGPMSIWHTPDVGEGVYNVYDPEKAEELLEEIGYDGEPIVFLGDSGFELERQAGVAYQEMLNKVGINLELDLRDRASFVERRAEPGGRHFSLSNFQQIYPDPQVYGAWMGTERWVGFWDDEHSRELDEIFARMQTELDFDKRHDIVREWNEHVWEYLPFIKHFNYSELATYRNEVNDLLPFENFVLFNVWLEE